MSISIPHGATGAALRALIAFSLLLPCTAVRAQERLPTIAPEAYTPAQKQAADAFLAERGTPVRGPFEPMMYSPEVMTRARAMGDYLRYHSLVGNRLSEFIILLTARDWNQDYEWSVHAAIAQKAGISPAIIEDLRNGRRPRTMGDDETMIYDFVMQLQRERRVSDEAFARVERRFGKPAVVDITAIVGYYALNAMMLNVAQVPPADGSRLPAPAASREAGRQH